METKRDFDLMALYTKFKNIATEGPADTETVLKIVAEILDILPKADKYIVDMEEELEDNTPHLDRRVINKFESITGKKLSNIELFTEDGYSIYEGHIDGLIKNLDNLAKVYANRHINYIEKENKALKDSNECYIKLIKRYRKKLNKQKANANYWRHRELYQEEQNIKLSQKINFRETNVIYLNDILTILTNDKKHLQTDLKMARENHINLMNAYNDLVAKTSDYESIKQAKEGYYHEWKIAEDLIKQRDNAIVKLRKENDELRTKYEKLFANQCKGTPGVDPNKKEETDNSSSLAKHQYYIHVFSDINACSNIIHSCIKSGDKVISILDSYYKHQCVILRDDIYISIIIDKDYRNQPSSAQVFNKDNELLINILHESSIIDYISKL